MHVSHYCAKLAFRHAYRLEVGDGFPDGGERAAWSGERLLFGEVRAGCCFDEAGMTGVALALPEGVPAALLG